MSVNSKCSVRGILALLVLCLIGPVSFAGSGTYHHSVSLGPDGKPSLQLTNDSTQPIVAFFMVEFPSLGMEGRTYYDFYLNQRELPITPGASITRGLSSFKGRGIEGSRRGASRDISGWLHCW